MIETLGLSWEQAAALSFALFLGGFVKGGLGFAFPMVSISIATQFVSLDLVLAIIAVLMPFFNIVQFANGRQMRRTLVRFWPMLAGLVVGTPLGALLFPIVDPRLLILTVGVMTLAFVATAVFHPIHIPERREKRFGAIAGVAAGMIGTLTTTNGPVFVSYLLGLQLDRPMLVSSLGLFFLLSGVLIAGSFLAIGVLDGPRALIALACFVPCGLGMWAGNIIGRRIPAELFRTLVLAFLTLLGANMILRAALGY